MPSVEPYIIAPEHWAYNYADYLYNFAVARLKDDEQAKDIVQETFLSALEKLSSFEGRSSEKTWLTSILKYKIMDIYRSRSTGINSIHGTSGYQSSKTFFQPHDGHWNIEDRPKDFVAGEVSAIENREFQHILIQCTEKLPHLWRNIFIMKFMDEEQTDFICKELKITPGNYWVIIHRAKLLLRACLEKNWL